MKKLALALATTATVFTGVMVAAPDSAEAGPYYRRGYSYGYGYRPYYRRGPGLGAVAAGVAGAAILGGVVAGATAPAYGYGYGYPAYGYAPAYGYGGGYGGYPAYGYGW